MPIISNVVNGAMGTGKFLALAYNNNEDYAKKVAAAFQTSAADGDSDHFISMVNMVEDHAKKYVNTPNLLMQIAGDMQRGEVNNLRLWFCTLLCAVVYGCENNTDIHIENAQFQTLNAAQVLTPIARKEFLSVWKHKFDSVNGVGNSNTAVINGNAAFGCDENSLNYLSLDSDNPNLVLGYPNTLGIYHDTLFVVPLKGFWLNNYPHIGQNDEAQIPAWKLKCYQLYSDGEHLLENLTKLNLKQRVLLNLTAKSIAANAPEPLKLFQGLVQKYVPVTEIAGIANVTVPSYKEIGALSFFKIEGALDLDDLVSNTLYIGMDFDSENCPVFRATYPITRTMIDGLESRISSVTNLKLTLEKDRTNPKAVKGAVFSFQYHSKFIFLTAPNAVVVPGAVTELNYIYQVTHEYDLNHMKGIMEMPSICMFPNLETKHEHLCKRYTYFACDGSDIMLSPVANFKENCISLAQGMFMGRQNNADYVLYGRGLKKDGVVKDFTERKTPSGTVHSTFVEEPEHFIKVCDINGSECGYIVNIKNTPALLEDDVIDFSVDPPKDPEPQTLFAYVDFGSSTSYVKYKIGSAGGLQGNYISDHCTLRPLLIPYLSNDDYKLIMNDPDRNNLSKFLSISSTYDVNHGVVDYYPYVDAWTPVVGTLRGYEPKIKTVTSHKTDLLVPGAPQESKASPNVIIYNICFTLACDAVANDCTSVEIIPSFPSEKYINSLSLIWNAAVNKMKVTFPNVNMSTYISGNTQNKGLLYESIAVSVGTQAPSLNTMHISIDMGDGTTDMSAVYIDGANVRHICGYASIEYAGKHLIKTVLKDILCNAPRDTVDKIFKGALCERYISYGTSLFAPNDASPSGNAEYMGFVDNLVNEFFRGTELQIPKDDSWENKVMDILSISKMQGSFSNDQKVAANFILRYMVLMPVIKDFIHTAIKNAGDTYRPESSSINVRFMGGSSKGIDLFKALDSKRTPNARDILYQYFKNEFDKIANGVNVTVSPIDDKQTLIDGLSQISMVGNALMINPVQLANIDWGSIDPQNVAQFGTEESVHTNVLRNQFEAITDRNGQLDTNASVTANNKILWDPTSYYENPANPYEEFNKFFTEEIYNKLIDNGDRVPDTIESLIQDFIYEASQNMKMKVNQQLQPGGGEHDGGNAFYKATHSCVYPEMMKNTIYMFAISTLLSEFHGTYRPDQTIREVADKPQYRFGG